jgi:putative hemolysin
MAHHWKQDNTPAGKVMDIAILLLLILLNGAFALSEMALVTARKGRLQTLSNQGDTGAAAALRLAEEPTRFLSTIQIGITSIGILNGIVGEAALAGPFAQWLQGTGLEERAAAYLSTGLVVVVITYFSIVFGELVPKRLGQINPETAARFVAKPMQWLALAVKPFVKLLVASTELVLRVLGEKRTAAPKVTEEEIRAVLLEGANAGVIEADEHAMVRNVFRLDDRQIGSLMVRRSDVVCLDASLSWEANLKRIAGSERTRFPVIDGKWSELLGVISARQLLAKAVVLGETPDLHSELQSPVYVPESLTGMELLQSMRNSGVQLAFVVDEFGDVLGIVTLQDVLEAITGEFKPQTTADAWAVQRDDGSWLIEGLIPIPELKDRLHIEGLPEEGRYHTLAGLLLLVLGHVPRVGDRAEWDGWCFEVMDMDGNRIDKVLASRVAVARH